MSDQTGGENGYSPLMGASNTPYDVSNTPRHEVLNFEGTPTQFSDDTGLRAILTRKGIMDVNSFNPIAKEGEKITADTPRQATNGEGQLLFLDSNGEQTTRPTGSPMVGGTIGDAAYMKAPTHGGGVLGDIGYDLRSTAKDPAFHKFLLTAAAIGTGGLAANAALGAGALGGLGGEVATAFPVSSGALLPGVELGAPALGVAGGDIGAFTTADAAASAAGGAGTTGAASSGITASEALRYANMAKSALGALGAGGASGAGGAGAAGTAGSSFAPFVAPAVGAGMFTTGLHQQAPATVGTEKLKMLFPELDPALARQLAMSGNTGSNLGGNYFAYGSTPTSLLPTPLSNIATQPNTNPMQAKDGGGVLQSFKDGGAPHVPEFITGATGHYVKGRGDGQSDDIPAMLADGEYVVDSSAVSTLGNGSSDSGAKLLDAFRESLREHTRSAPKNKIPPKASPLMYMKEAMKKVGMK